MKENNLESVLESFYALSDHLTNNKQDYYQVPKSKLQDICNIYNKDKAILITFDEKHNSLDITTVNIDVDDTIRIKLERMLKLSKLNTIKQ